MNAVLSLIESAIRNISGTIGRKIRFFYYKKRFGACGNNFYIDEGVIFEHPECMFFGNNVWIDKYCILIAGQVSLNETNCKSKTNKNYRYNEGELHIGSNIHIAPQCIIQAHGGVEICDNFIASAGCKIYSLSNDVKSYNDEKSSKREVNYILSPIVIKKNVWMGLNVVQLAGTIEENSFISPFSLVMTSIPANSFAAGNPAKRLKSRFDLEENL